VSRENTAADRFQLSAGQIERLNNLTNPNQFGSGLVGICPLREEAAKPP
jgi:hypothetical protein